MKIVTVDTQKRLLKKSTNYIADNGFDTKTIAVFGLGMRIVVIVLVGRLVLVSLMGSYVT